jgi:hypothetical protein
MSPILSHVFLAGSIVVLAAACILLARHHRRLPWLAGSRASTCLFLTGTAAACTPFVEGASWLFIAWAGYGAIAFLHLASAQQALARSESRGATRVPMAEASRRANAVVPRNNEPLSL